MKGVFKKFLVLLPVILLGLFYLYSHHDAYHQVRNKRLLFLALTFLFLYGWMFLETVLRKQHNFFQIITQAGFYVFVFMVLTLTGYFILFREVAAHDWWHKMMVRIGRRDHVNFELFKMFTIYRIFSMQVVGNFFMLFPLGIFLPILYRRVSGLWPVFLISLLLSTLIEVLQLITRFRSTDVDDVFLNVLGACTGFLMYKLAVWAINPTSQKSPALLINESRMA